MTPPEKRLLTWMCDVCGETDPRSTCYAERKHNAHCGHWPGHCCICGATS